MLLGLGRGPPGRGPPGRCISAGVGRPDPPPGLGPACPDGAPGAAPGGPLRGGAGRGARPMPVAVWL